MSIQDEMFKSAIRTMKAYCQYQWQHVPKDQEGDFEYSACIKCPFDPFCEKNGLRTDEVAGPCDWRITHTRGPKK